MLDHIGSAQAPLRDEQAGAAQRLGEPSPADAALHDLSLVEIAELIRTLAVSPVELLEMTFARIAALDGGLHAYARLMTDSAREDARRAEREIAAERYLGPLHGVPIGVKDLFWTKGVATAAGSSIHSDFLPPEDATAVRRLREAGAVIVGKLEMTEGAYSEHHRAIDAPRNPWGADLWPGISSSGSAVAVAAGICFGATASDTGGSIRWPAAANGVTGLKPTWGAVSRHGTFALAASLDHMGAIARSAADVAAMLNVMAGPDIVDPTSAAARENPCAAPGNEGLAGLTVGVDPLWNSTDVDDGAQRALRAAADTLRDLGAEIVEVAAPDVTDAVADWPLACAIEAAAAHEATYPSRKAEYGDVLASVIESGRAAAASDLQRIQLRRLRLRGEFQALFRRIDVLLAPVHPFAPLTLADIATLGAQPDLVAKLQRFTCPFNMTGDPTLTLPAGADPHGLPIAIQLIGGAWSESALVRAGVAFQAATAWHRRRPPVGPRP